MEGFKKRECVELGEKRDGGVEEKLEGRKWHRSDHMGVDFILLYA